MDGCHRKNHCGRRFIPLRQQQGDDQQPESCADYTLDPDKLEALANIFSRENDVLGQILSDRALPQRIRGAPRI
ncbi:MAG: hypothetical protein IKU14_09775 [Rhodocyclaceae bacterium]|nr:hypothetical protein [Rhodocyclaceae bacterium]